MDAEKGFANRGPPFRYIGHQVRSEMSLDGFLNLSDKTDGLGDDVHGLDWILRHNLSCLVD